MTSTDQLIALIYETILDPGRWPVVLRSLAEATGCIDATLVAGDFRPDAAQGLFGAVSGTIFNEELLPLYLNHYIRWDPLNPGGRLPPTGAKVVSNQLISNTEVRHNPFFQELLIPNGGHHYGGWVVLNEGTKIVGVTLHQRDAPLELDMLDRWSGVAHHLGQAAFISARLAPKLAAAEGFRKALDTSRTACLLLDETSRVIDASAAGFEIVGKAEILRTALNGVLRLETDDATWRFRQAVADACAGRAGRTLVFSFKGNRTVRFQVIPSGTVSENPFNPNANNCALVIIYEIKQYKQQEPGRIQTVLGCTMAEAKIAAMLATGLSPQQIADRRGASIHTVRAQIRALFQAAGTNRIALLVALVNRL